MLHVEIKALGTALPKNFVTFAGGRRYRIADGETHLGLLCESARRALAQSGMTIADIDVIIGACAAGVQPIPCTAALVHEALTCGSNIPAFDVNSTCTGFITALDVAGHYIQAGKYRNVLIVSGDTPSVVLNEAERHSFELFGDGAVSAVVTASETGGIYYHRQMTASAGAHLTEIQGGGTRLPAVQYQPDNRQRYLFHMHGKDALLMTMQLVRDMIAAIETESGMTLADVDLIVPHQASAALSLIMRKLGVPEGKYVDMTRTHGNMVSASIPFALDDAIRAGRMQRGDTVLLLGTAAGLTVNAMLLRY